MSDWIGVYSTAESIKAGLDLEMPCVFILSVLLIALNLPHYSGPTVMRGNAVMRALAAQKLFPSDIDDRVRKVHRILFANIPVSPHLDPRATRKSFRVWHTVWCT
jgi:beta-glucosidase